MRFTACHKPCLASLDCQQTFPRQSEPTLLDLRTDPFTHGQLSTVTPYVCKRQGCISIPQT
ncbi:hypothetical protein JAAARDRAFT_256038 [Jaapia argillacea MUCL 33604]|uniref:Uncharacterized protein n=1 Tax=Jaapia argillacea MUCL 33604 TaxID=933084 RepID=A0A067PTL3_9AGAM|nr:hypothetical protein JAAARDRAFT_256038 [Jaapia argillacea MUCL 33604]